MKCTCCGEEADSVLETLLGGVSFVCQDCADSFFAFICLVEAEHVKHA